MQDWAEVFIIAAFIVAFVVMGTFALVWVSG